MERLLLRGPAGTNQRTRNGWQKHSPARTPARAAQRPDHDTPDKTKITMSSSLNEAISRLDRPADVEGKELFAALGFVSVIFLSPAAAFLLFAFVLAEVSMGEPRLTGEVADYSAASLAHKALEVKIDEGGLGAELDADGTLRLGRLQGQMDEVVPEGWSWQRGVAGGDAGLCLGAHDASPDARCYRVSVENGKLLRPAGTRFGRIVKVYEPETAPPVSQELRDITGR